MWLTYQPILNKCYMLQTLSRGLQITLHVSEACKVCDVKMDYIHQTPGIYSLFGYWVTARWYFTMQIMACWFVGFTACKKLFGCRFLKIFCVHFFLKNHKLFFQRISGPTNTIIICEYHNSEFEIVIKSREVYNGMHQTIWY